jgi:hypothetical protein
MGHGSVYDKGESRSLRAQRGFTLDRVVCHSATSRNDGFG